MLGEKYDITFDGKIDDAKDIDGVKQQVQTALKLSDGELAYLFTGQNICLKRNLSFADAQILKPQLEKLGLLVSLTPSTPTQDPPLNLTDTQQKDDHRRLLSTKYDDYDNAIDNQTLEGSIPPTFAFNKDGRLGPLNFLNAQLRLILTILPLIILSIILMLMDFPEVILNTSKIITIAIYVIFSYRMVVLRLQDLDKSHWFVLLFLAFKIPYVGPYIVLLFVLYLFLTPGSEEMNQYGPPTTQGSKLGIIIFFLLIPIFAGASYYLGQQHNSKLKFVANGIALTYDLQEKIKAYYADNSALPTSLYQLHMSIMSPDPTVIIGVELTKDSNIKINYSFKVQTEGYLILTPVIHDKIFTWRCHQSNLDDRIIPHQCQQEMATTATSND